MDTMRDEQQSQLKQIDLLKLDKAFLERENQDAKYRVKHLEQVLMQRSADLEAVKTDQLTQFQASLKVSEQHRAEYETRLREELVGIRQRAEMDLESVRTNARQFYEREIL
jgi:hypothetical protein